MLQVVSWFWGVVLIVLAMGMMDINFLTGIFWFAAGIIILPPFREYLKTKHRLEPKVKTLAWTAFGFVISPIFIFADSINTVPSNPPAQTVQAGNNVSIKPVVANETRRTEKPILMELVDYKVEQKSCQLPHKCSYDVRIKEKISKNQIQDIAAEIYSTSRNTNRTFITFWLPCMEIGAGAWATAHYDPEMSISIMDYMIPANNTCENNAAPLEKKVATKWLYSERQDDLRGAKIYHANITSNNKHEFDFPYNGGAHLDITIRKHPEWEIDVIFRVEKGHYNCSSYKGCTGMISVDGKPEQLTLSEPSDHSRDVLFAKYSAAILGKLKGSKKVIVELPFFQEGNRQFIFETEGLEWNH